MSTASRAAIGSKVARFLLLFALACGDDDGSTGAGDAGVGDASASDANRPDAPTGRPDAGLPDAGEPDAGAAPCTAGCDVVEVTAGQSHSCARRSNGTVVCWGNNFGGELGDGFERHGTLNDCTDAEDVERVDCVGTPVTVAELTDATALYGNAGSSTCARRAAGGLVCWGREIVAAVGSSERRKRFRPEAPGDFADAVDVSFGAGHMCGTNADGSVRCIGNNEYGQIGSGRTDIQEQNPVLVSGLASVVDVETAAGFGAFSCARSATTTWCWGLNRTYELGDGRRDHGECRDEAEVLDCAAIPVEIAELVPLTSIVLGSNFGCGIDAERHVQCWGDNSVGQLTGPEGEKAVPTPVQGLDDVVELAAGGLHVCARRENGEVYCWGSNEEGQVGDGTFDHDSCVRRSRRIDCVRAPTRVTSLPAASDLASGQEHVCAATTDGAVYCWGWNERKQLGGEGREHRATPMVVPTLDAN